MGFGPIKTASIVVTPTIQPFSTQTSTYEVGKSSRRTKRSKRPALRNRTPIRFNLDDDGNIRKVYDKYYGISKEYYDHGDPTFECKECHALLWEAEAKRGNPNPVNKAYSICCKKGKVMLEKPPATPKPLLDLFLNDDGKSQNFRNNIRTYNSMFAFTSMGGKVDDSINRRGRGPYVFLLHGQTYHSMGSLLPQEGAPLKFAQLYIYDTDNEIENRARAFNNSSGSSGRSNSKHPIDRDIMNEVKDVLDASSDLVKTFRRARDWYNEDNKQNIRIKLVAKRDRETNIQSSDLQRGLERINIFHPLYLPLQYPLLMPCGQDGYHLEIPRRKKYGEPATGKKDKTVSMREWFSYQIQDRTNQENLFTRGGRLFQQFLVDGYTMVEIKRLYFHRAKQSKLRCDTYSNIRSSITAGNTDSIILRKPVVLSSSFTGGPRYIRQNYMDAMASCRWYGCLDLFITITCNPNWPDIVRYIRENNLTSTNRPDVVLRVFKMKLDQLMKDVKELPLFRRVQAGPDRVSAELYEPAMMVDGEQIQKPVDEIKAYLDCRYLSACEAAWRLFGFEVQYRTQSVERLSFHLSGEQQVLYEENSDLETVLHKPSVGHRMMLLNSAKGCRTHDEIKKVNEVVYPTYKEACYATGLLEDDKEYIECIKDATHWATAEHLCELFVTLLSPKELTMPLSVLLQTWNLLAEDVQFKRRQILKRLDLVVSDEEKKNVALFYIEELMRSRGTTLRRWLEMPYPNERYIFEFGNRLIYDELYYNLTELQSEYERLYVSLNTKQKSVYDTIMNSVERGKGGVYFVYGYGGTGKTFLWKILAAGIRRKGDIVLNVASSGIASLLMLGDRTTHSRFHITINIDETSTCSICPQSDLGALLKMCKLIIWEEAPMTNKLCFEALDRTLRDVLRRTRQVLPVIPKGSRQDIVNAYLKQSYLWDHCKVLKLTTNMRLTVGASPEDVCEIRDFAEWILKVEDGELGEANDGEVSIDVPEELLIDAVDDPVTSIIDFTYPNLLDNINDPSYFQEKAILAPTNEVVDTINDHLLNKFPGEEMVYLSCDSIDKTERGFAIDEAVFSSEFINGLKFSGVPNHRLALKVGDKASSS
ncbi:ATP-dependent DNA helicase PIF1 [Tanacetum coccineum]